jgi:hypothetical protein
MNDVGLVVELERRCDGLLGRCLERSARELRERRSDRPFQRHSRQERGGDAAARLDDLLQRGDRDGAHSLAATRRSELCSTDRGVAALEMLGLAPQLLRLPSGRLNLLQLSRRVARGELTLPSLARTLLDAGWRLHTQPDVALVCFNAARATDFECASRFLRRYQRALGLPGCVDWRAPEGPNDALSGFGAGPMATTGGPLVSVLVPARNAAGTLVRALDSLLGQTYRDVEILVGDDASEDATTQVLARQYASEPRVRRFGSRRRQGAYNMKNALFARARGSLIAFHDADDWALPCRIALQVARLRSASVLACVGNGLRLRAGGEVVFFKDQRATRLSPVSLLLRRETFQALGGFRAAVIGADQELYAKLRAQHGVPSMSRLRVPLILSAWSAGSVTRQPGTESLEDGYRSPVRRTYSELVSRRYERGENVSDAAFDAMLREHDNYLEPREIEEF